MTKKAIIDQQIEDIAEANEVSVKQAAKMFVNQSENAVEMDFEPLEHNWIDRGAKMSCEGAGHAHHQAWKQRR